MARLLIVERMPVPLPRRRVLSYLWDMEHLADYEPKVDAVTVSPSGSRAGAYLARGRFAGIPWRGRFSYTLTEGGFHSEMLSGPVKVRGGFAVRALAEDSCEVTHSEEYELPIWARPLAPLLKAYLRSSLKQELANVGRGAAGISPL